MPNNADFDNALVPFAGSDGGKSVLYELAQTKPSTIICGLRYSFLPSHGVPGSNFRVGDDKSTIMSLTSGRLCLLSACPI